MRKHVNNVVSFISKNPYSFVLIVLIMICISMTPYLLSSFFTGLVVDVDTIPYFLLPFGLMLTLTERVVSAFLMNIFRNIIVFLVMSLISAFLYGAFLAYLDSGKTEKNRIAIFFSTGIKKLFRAWGALTIQTIIGIFLSTGFFYLVRVQTNPVIFTVLTILLLITVL